MNLRRTTVFGLAAILTLTQATLAVAACCCVPTQIAEAEVNSQLFNAGHCPGCAEPEPETAAKESDTHCGTPDSPEPMDKGCATMRLDTSEFAPLFASVSVQVNFTPPVRHEALGNVHFEPRTYSTLNDSNGIFTAPTPSLSLIHQSFLI